MVSKSLGKKIKKLKDDGLSQHKIAKKLKIAQSTVSDYLKSIGYESDQSKTKKAVDTKKTFDKERRLALNDAFYEKVHTMLEGAESPSELRYLAITYGIIEDKRSLLDPAQTSSKGVAAIDAYFEEMKREAPEDECETKV